MKPLYWKFLLIFGAMIIGASLIVPKALRKNADRITDATTHTVLLESANDKASFEALSAISKTSALTIDKPKVITASYYVNFLRISFEIAARFIASVIAPKHSLSVGAMPVKSRVID